MKRLHPRPAFCKHQAGACRLAGLPPAAQALSTGPALQRLAALLAVSRPDALPAAWFAATALGRAAACQPALGQTAAATGALAALVPLLQGPGNLQLAALAAMLQLVMCSRQNAHPDRLLQVGFARQALLCIVPACFHLGCSSQGAAGHANSAGKLIKPPRLQPQAPCCRQAGCCTLSHDEGTAASLPA